MSAYLLELSQGSPFLRSLSYMVNTRSASPHSSCHFGKMVLSGPIAYRQSVAWFMDGATSGSYVDRVVIKRSSSPEQL
jgi:hypothetical protein